MFTAVHLLADTSYHTVPSFSIVYSHLRRLLGEGYLTSSWQESSQGLPPRKYYAVTERGMEYLEAMSGEWERLLAAINEIKEGAQHG